MIPIVWYLKPKLAHGIINVECLAYINKSAHFEWTISF